jgi:hypothetical protein
MQNNYLELNGGTRDYGLLTDISKSVNQLLGDTSGRTVSMRTAQGFKCAFGVNVSDDRAEDIVHLGMIASVSLLRSEKEGSRTSGFLLALGLAICYHNA